jgi:hypothetical protein
VEPNGLRHCVAKKQSSRIPSGTDAASFQRRFKQGFLQPNGTFTATFDDDDTFNPLAITAM